MTVKRPLYLAVFPARRKALLLASSGQRLICYYVVLTSDSEPKPLIITVILAESSGRALGLLYTSHAFQS